MTIGVPTSAAGAGESLVGLRIPSDAPSFASLSAASAGVDASGASARGVNGLPGEDCPSDVSADPPGASAGDLDGSLFFCARVELTADAGDGESSAPPELAGIAAEDSPGGLLPSAAASVELGEAVTWA